MCIRDSVYYGVDIWREAEASWRRLQTRLKPEQYMEIRYEDLLEDIQGGLGRICSFLGLEYSDRMMDYVRTSSYAMPDKRLSYQWKHKLSPRELQLVEGKLDLPVAGIGYEPSGQLPAQPGLLEHLGLFAGNKAFRFRFQADRYGLGLYLSSFAANKLGLRRWAETCLRRRNEIDVKHLK